MPDQPTSPDPLFLAFQLALAGRYSIDRELGRGGMGVVYLAREVHLDRLVAIKLLPPDLCARPALRERFLREARLAAKLSHPHIIPIHAVDEADGFVYYVMAYVDGETLAQRVHARGPLSATDGIRLLREAAWALGHAHGQGLVHRDVKPDNILIESASGRALVADFGIAAANGDALGDGVSGTPEFMSPEQALGHDVDARSDIYSLGATAFYALSGRLPFEGRTVTETLARQVTEPAPSLSTVDIAGVGVAGVGIAVPRKLAGIVDRCLAKDPADRPETAQALAEQLGVAIEQRRELPAALRAFVKRNGRMNGGGTLLLLTGALLGASAASALVGPAAGVLALLGTAAIAPAVFGVVAARRLLDLGFAHADLAPAFRAEQESSREEHGVQRGRIRGFMERGLRGIARVSASTCAVVLAMSVVTAGTPRSGLLGLLAFVGLFVAVFSTIGHLAFVGSRRDVDVEFWNAAWTGRFGALAFAAARAWRGSRHIGPAMTHRATELSLGMAAEQLFDSLPKASRDVLGDVPALLARLQDGAGVLRARYERLQEALAQAGGAAPSESYAAVRAERDDVHERLRVTVGALETVRLNLLRLHAGSMSLEGLTTHIALAAEASADVQRLAEAHQEIDAALKRPRVPHLPQAPQLTSV